MGLHDLLVAYARLQNARYVRVSYRGACTQGTPEIEGVTKRPLSSAQTGADVVATDQEDGFVYT